MAVVQLRILNGLNGKKYGVTVKATSNGEVPAFPFLKHFATQIGHPVEDLEILIKDVGLITDAQYPLPSNKTIEVRPKQHQQLHHTATSVAADSAAHEALRSPGTKHQHRTGTGGVGNTHADSVLASGSTTAAARNGDAMRMELVAQCKMLAESKNHLRRELELLTEEVRTRETNKRREQQETNAALEAEVAEFAELEGDLMHQIEVARTLIEEDSASWNREREVLTNEAENLERKVVHQLRASIQQSEDRRRKLTDKLDAATHETLGQRNELRRTREATKQRKSEVDAATNRLDCSRDEILKVLQDCGGRVDKRDEEAAQFVSTVTAQNELLNIQLAKLQKEHQTLHANSQRLFTQRRQLHSEVEDAKGNIRVIVRLRPLVPADAATPQHIGHQEEATLFADAENHLVVATSPTVGLREFEFFSVYGPTRNSVQQQDTIFEEQVAPLMQSLVDGCNVCVMAYGQTGSGKTFTILGSPEQQENNRVISGGDDEQSSDAGFNEGGDGLSLGPTGPTDGYLTGLFPQCLRYLFDEQQQRQLLYQNRRKNTQNKGKKKKSKSSRSKLVKHHHHGATRNREIAIATGGGVSAEAYERGLEEEHEQQGEREEEEQGLLDEEATNESDDGHHQRHHHHHQHLSFTLSMVELYLDDVYDLVSTMQTGTVTKCEVRMLSSSSAGQQQQPSSTSRLGAASKVSAGGASIVGAREVELESVEHAISLLSEGLRLRQTHKTLRNASSSRSHLLLTLTLRNPVNGGFSSQLVFADLAGSERVSRSLSSGDRLKEAQHINKSLSALGDVMAALSSRGSTPTSTAAAGGSNKTPYIPYRNSKLTSILQNCLGGRSKTLLMTCICPHIPHQHNLAESLSTLQFASRTKLVKNIVQKRKLNREGGMPVGKRRPESAGSLASNTSHRQHPGGLREEESDGDQQHQRRQQRNDEPLLHHFRGQPSAVAVQPSEVAAARHAVLHTMEF